MVEFSNTYDINWIFVNARSHSYFIDRSRELRLRKALIDLGVRRRVVRVSAGEDGGSEAWVDKVVKHELGVCHLTKDFCFFSVVIFTFI